MHAAVLRIDFSLRFLAAAFLLPAMVALAQSPAGSAGGGRVSAPRIWNYKDLATWALPITGVNATPNFYSEAEYYAAPVAEFRTYPVYHPDREPAGYMEWLRQLEPKPLVDPAEVRSDADWVGLGQRVFDAHRLSPLVWLGCFRPLVDHPLPRPQHIEKLPLGGAVEEAEETQHGNFRTVLSQMPHVGREHLAGMAAMLGVLLQQQDLISTADVVVVGRIP